MALHYQYLVDQPQECRRVVSWWDTVWSDLIGPNLDQVETQLRQSLSKTQLPIHLLAYQDNVPVGSAALKQQELDSLYPDCHYWLGSVFVDESYRGAKIASEISLKIIELAQDRGLPHLYLQTANLSGGLYADLGWKPIERFWFNDEEALLMLNTFD